MIQMMVPFLLALALSLLPISLRLEGYYFMADEKELHAVLTIPLNPDNRGAFLIWVSPDATSGASYVQLDALTTRIRHPFSPRLNPGHYTFWGRLVQQEKITDTAIQHVQVIRITP